jgi:hypothetical protein
VIVVSRRLVLIAYLVTGVIVASSKDYLDDLDTTRRLASALLGIALWPLLFLGVDLHVD